MIEFFIDCVPFQTTHQAKKIVRVGKWSRLADKPELVQAKKTYESLLEKYQPTEPLTGPVRLTLAFMFPHLKSSPKRVREMWAYPKVTKPDCSNLAKMFEDCLVRMRFIVDDAQVCDLLVQKWFSKTSGVLVRIDKLNNGENDVNKPCLERIGYQRSSGDVPARGADSTSGEGDRVAPQVSNGALEGHL